jgi:PAP_fibrillin
VIVDLQTQKADLLSRISHCNNGLSPLDQVTLAQIAELEAQTPNPRPVAALDLLEGDWKLVYTNSQGILGLDRVPLFQLGTVYQSIRAEGLRLYNVAEIQGLPLLSGIVSVAATFVPLSEVRVEVAFERAIVGPQGWMGYQGPAGFIASIERGDRFWALDAKLPVQSAKGWLDITYLDADLRIGRGSEGSLFVLVKD